MGDMADYYIEQEMFRPIETGRQPHRLMTKQAKEQLKRDAKDPLYWHSQNGRLTPIANMDDQHLKNTIAWMERRGATSIPYASEGASEEEKRIIETQVKILGFSLLMAKRYPNLLKERARREEKKRAEEAAHDTDPAAR